MATTNDNPQYYIPQPPSMLRYHEEHVQAVFNAWRDACRKQTRLQRRLDKMAADGLTILDRKYYELSRQKHEAWREGRDAYENWEEWAKLVGLPVSRNVEKQQQEYARRHKTAR